MERGPYSAKGRGGSRIRAVEVARVFFFPSISSFSLRICLEKKSSFVLVVSFRVRARDRQKKWREKASFHKAH